MKFTQIPSDTFANIQLNAGILVEDFNPATGEVSGLIGATSGGISASLTPTFTDYGDDIDNCPKNMLELKKLESYEAKLSGSFVTVTAASAKRLVGAADLVGNKITPRNDLATTDFKSIWWVGDYSDKNGTNNGGFVAIHLLNSLNTSGFQIQSTDKAKGKFSFEFTGHYSMNAQTTVPFELYVKAGTPESGEYQMTVTAAAGATSGTTAITTGATASASQSYVIQTGYNLYLPAENTVLAGSAWTAWDGDDDIDADEGMDVVVAIITTADKKAVHAGMTRAVVAE